VEQHLQPVRGNPLHDDDDQAREDKDPGSREDGPEEVVC
jgi:hypothetical protein